jgi:hypothetical protein
LKFKAFFVAINKLLRKKIPKKLKLKFKNILDSGLFHDLKSEHIACNVTHNTDDYLMLLNTFSQYGAIAQQTKNALFEGRMTIRPYSSQYYLPCPLVLLVSLV